MPYNRTTYPTASKFQRRTGIAALALATALIGAMSITGASAGYSLDDPASDDAGWTKLLDLGVDISGVARTQEGVRTYIAKQAPVTQQVIMTTCEHYMVFPQGLKSADTYPFCRI